MSHNMEQLVSQGRAKSLKDFWNEVELEALITLERERGIARTVAADYIRNGILTLEDYDKAVKAKFVPATQEEAEAEVAESMVKRAKAALKGKRKK